MGNPGTHAIVGCVHELDLIDSVLAELAGGRGAALWLEGEPGIGKTTLCDALAARAAARGFPVHRSAAEESFRAFPLRSVAAALEISARSPDPLRKEVAEMLHRGSTSIIDPVLAATELIGELVDRLCAGGPVVLIVEDLQWADEPTLLLLERLARTLDQLTLLLVGTCHPATPGDAVGRLRDEATVMPVTPLRSGEVIELATLLLGAAPEPALAEQLEHTGGNPLYVRELVLGWSDGEETPSSLSAAIDRRLRRLGDDTRSVLRLAALLDQRFEVGHLAAVTGRAVTDLATGLALAATSGLLSEDGPRFSFRHELVRRVLADEIPFPVRVALHRQIARSLAESGADVAIVARHLLAGGGTPEPWAIRWMADIPETALVIAPHVAVELLGSAIEAPAAVGRRFDLLASRYTAVCFTLGLDEKASEAAAHVAHSTTDPALRARMQLYRMRLATRRGRHEEALAITEAALADPELPPLWSARLRARSAAVLLRCHRPDDALREAARALEEATVVADPVAAGHSRLVLAYEADAEGGLKHFDAALLGLGNDPDSTELRVLLLNNRLAALNNLGRAADFAAAVDDVLIVAGRVGAARSGHITASAAMGLYDFGAWDDASAHLESTPPPQPTAVLMVREGLSALIAGHREDWDRLREHVRAGDALPRTAGEVRIFSGYLVAARALRAEASGDLPGAIAELATWLDDGLGYDARERFMWMPSLVRLALTAGDRATAERAVAAAAADAAHETRLIRQRLAADFCRAQLDDDVDTLRAVAAEAGAHGWVVLKANADEEAAVRLAGRDVPAARAALGEAVRGYSSAGATFDVRRADSRLRASGIRRGPRSAHRRPRTGWEALTPTEARVARLVAGGLSNPDIAAELYLSRRTAQTHVSRVLTKLGMSRVELIRSTPPGPAPS